MKMKKWFSKIKMSSFSSKCNSKTELHMTDHNSFYQIVDVIQRGPKTCNVTSWLGSAPVKRELMGRLVILVRLEKPINTIFTFIIIM